eukprot:1650445-Pyramimonas_sp.AAC.1
MRSALQLSQRSATAGPITVRARHGPLPARHCSAEICTAEPPTPRRRANAPCFAARHGSFCNCTSARTGLTG